MNGRNWYSVFGKQCSVIGIRSSSWNHRIIELSNLALFLLVLTLLAASPASAQTISYSIPKKLSAKTPDFRILGKNKEGTLIYKYGKEHVVEAFSSNMNVRWSKTLSFKRAVSDVRRIVIYPEKTLAFYLSADKGFTTLLVEKWNSKFQAETDAITLDTVKTEKFEVESLVRVAPSQNQSKIVSYYPVFGENNSDYLRMTLVDADLKILLKKNIPITEGEKALKLRKVFPDNDGNVFILLEDEAKAKKKEVVPNAFRIKMVEKETGTVKDINFDFQRPVFKKLYLEVDNVNKNLIATGLYTDDVGEEAQGYFYCAYDLDSNRLVANQYVKFSSEIIFEVTGKDTSKNVSGFYSFEVYDLILRFDGGAIIVAESRFNTEESMQVPSFTPTIGPSFRTISISYYNDVMLISVKPDGTLEWSQVLKKKQISEDDEGFFSSYLMATTAGKLHFIYNEEIYHKTSVSDYVINKYGQFEREYLFNAGDKNVMLTPKLGKQISSNEVLIPSYKRSYLSFVKLTY